MQTQTTTRKEFMAKRKAEIAAQKATIRELARVGEQWPILPEEYVKRATRYYEHIEGGTDLALRMEMLATLMSTEAAFLTKRAAQIRKRVAAGEEIPPVPLAWLETEPYK